MNIITFPDSPYRLHQPFEPAGDQPTATRDRAVGGADEDVGESGWLRLGNVAR